VATISRMLKSADEHSVGKLREAMQDLVLGRIRTLDLAGITLDFDGSVQSTKRRAEGTAVGFKKEEEGSTQLLPPLLHGGPNRPGTGCFTSTRQCS